MHSLRWVPVIGFATISFLSNSVIAQTQQLWAINCQAQQCLDATTADTNGTVQVSQCDESKQAQNWTQNQPFPGHIQNGYFGHSCLDMNTKTSAVTNECNKDLIAQRWTFGAWKIKSEIRNAYWGIEDGTNTPHCLQVQDGEINSAPCNGQNNQMWYWIPKGETSACPE